MSKKRRFLSPAVMGAVCGLVVGVVLSLEYLDRLPIAFQPISMWTQTKKKNDFQSTEYVLHVNILGIWKYDKLSFDPDAFRLEKYILEFTPLVIVAVICSLLGAFACRFIDQVIERKYLPKPDQ